MEPISATGRSKPHEDQPIPGQCRSFRSVIGSIRWLPFAAVAVVGQISAAWPPGPTDMGAFWVSTALLVLSACIVVFRRVAVPRTWLIRVGIYITSVTFLMIATGGVSSGLGALLLIPVVGVALYGRRWESAVVVGVIVVALFGVSLATPHVAAATARRLLLFGAIATMFSVAIHSLRDLLIKSNERTGRLLRQEEAINAAARQLTLAVDPPAIMALGAQLAAHIASPPGSEVRRASYLLIEDGVVQVGAQFDESGMNVEKSWPAPRASTPRRSRPDRSARRGQPRHPGGGTDLQGRAGTTPASPTAYGCPCTPMASSTASWASRPGA